MWTNPRKAMKNTTGGTFSFFWGARIVHSFALLNFFFKRVFASPPPGLSQEGRATATRRRRLVRPPSLYRVPPAASSLGPCSCPSAAVAAQEGKREEPAQKAAGQTPTSGRNKRRQRRARLWSFPVSRLSQALQPLSPD